MTFLLAVLQPSALMVFQHAMLRAEVAGAESAVADDALSRILAFFEGAADFLWRHPASDGDRKGEEGVRGKIERAEGW